MFQLLRSHLPDLPRSHTRLTGRVPKRFLETSARESADVVFCYQRQETEKEEGKRGKGIQHEILCGVNHKLSRQEANVLVT